MSKPLKVLIVEDRLTDAELMVYELNRSGFEPEWQRVETEADYLAECKKNPDVILTDHNLPELDAPRVLELLKQSGLDIPCIVVTGTISEEVAAQRIKDGAADYILKDRMTRLGQAVERALEDKRLRAEKLRTEARKFAILESALDCIVTMDAEGKIVEFNPAAEKAFGYSSREAVGKDMAELIIPHGLRGKHRAGLAHYLASGEGPALGKRLEVTALRSDGSEFPVELAISRINMDGPPLFTGYIRDISDRKRKEEEILKLAAIVESATEAIVGYTLEGIITSWNGGAEQLYGYSAEEARGRSFSILIPTDLPDELPNILERLKHGERIDHFEAVRRHKDGRHISVSVTVSPVKDAQGNLIGGSSIARDITEQKRAEEALRAIPLRDVRRSDLVTSIELGIIVLVSALVYAAAGYFDLFPKATAWILNDHPRLDEVAVAFVFLVMVLSVFSYRRWRHLNAEIAGRAKAEAALRTLHGELEIRVQERTSDLARSNQSLKDEIAQRRRAQEEIRRNLDRIQALHEIDRAITSSLDLHAVLNVLLEKIEIFLPMAAATTVRLFDPKTRELQSLACRGVDDQEWRSQVRAASGGRAASVVKTKTAMTVRNVLTDPRTTNVEFYRRHGLVSYLAVPLIAHEEVLGVLNLYTSREYEFNTGEVDFLKTLAGQAAVAIHNAQLYDQTQVHAAALKKANADLIRREEVQKVLKDLSQDILSLETDTLLNKLTAGVRGVFGVDVCDVRILSDSQHWQVRGASGVDPHVIRSAQSGSVHGRARWIFKNRKPLMIPDGFQDDRFPSGDTTRELGLRGYLGVPLCSKGDEVIGVLRVLTYKPREFSPEEIDLLQQFANGAAAAIQNARLYDETKNQALSLDAANKVKDEFLSVMSHELRTPLSVIMGYAGMLRDRLAGAITEAQEKILDKMLSRGREQLNIINDIMQTTQLESLSMLIDKKPVNVATLFQTLKADYSSTSKNVSLQWSHAADLPVIVTDQNKLRQILQNLIDNALKFAPGGEITVSAELVNDGGNMKFQVSDNGIGIPQNELSRIFEKFHQVDSSETRSYGGVGLGLYIVKKFTDLLGGEISITSELGRGTTIAVLLPLAFNYPSALHAPEKRPPLDAPSHT